MCLNDITKKTQLMLLKISPFIKRLLVKRWVFTIMVVEVIFKNIFLFRNVLK